VHPSMVVRKEQELIDFVFDDQYLLDPNTTSRRAILTPLNSDADRINMLILDRLPKERNTQTYYALNMPINDNPTDTHNSDHDLINLADENNGSIPPHKLTLTEGCSVMLLRNISIPQGLCNGTILRVKKLGEKFVEVEYIDGPYKGQSVHIPPFRFENDTKKSNGSAVEFTRTQFPFRVAYALTIHKAQGCTFDRVGVHLQHELWSHGHLYVAASRVTSQDGIKFFIPLATLRSRWDTTTNTVYPPWRSYNLPEDEIIEEEVPVAYDVPEVPEEDMNEVEDHP
jgi:PIF1-like helicase